MKRSCVDPTFRRPGALLALWLGLSLPGGSVPAQSAPPPPQRAADAAGFFVKVVPLKQAEAESVAATIQSLYRQPNGALVAVADARTNSILLRAERHALEGLEALVKDLDVESAQRQPGGALTTKVLQLKNAKVDAILEKVLGQALSMLVKLAVDPRTDSVIVQGDEKAVQTAEAIVAFLDRPVEGRGASENKRIRVVLLSQDGVERGLAVPDDLKGVAGELARVGVDQLRLLSQALVTVARGDFSLTVQPPEGIELTAHGVINEKRDKPPELNITLIASVKAEKGQPPVKLCEVKTILDAVPGQPVVLCMGPVEKGTLVFVLQLLP